jgi:hypothetical protein
MLLRVITILHERMWPSISLLPLFPHYQEVPRFQGGYKSRIFSPLVSFALRFLSFCGDVFIKNNMKINIVNDTHKSPLLYHNIHKQANKRKNLRPPLPQPQLQVSLFDSHAYPTHVTCDSRAALHR